MNRRHFLLGTCGVLTLGRATVGHAATVCGPVVPPGIQQCESGIDSMLAYVSAERQSHSQWCWAACIAMIFRYYGRPVSQSRIVSDTWGSIVNMPAQPIQILQNLNRPWIADNGRPFGVVGDVFSANPITAAQDLAADMPLIIGTLGHAMVLTSLVYNRDVYGNGNVVQATVRDPWMDRGRRTLTPQEWYSTTFLARIRIV